MMICVIEAKHKCVWGYGETPAAAMAHAREVIKEKNEKIHPLHSDLSFAQLSPDADLRDDGQGLWKWVIQDQQPERVGQMGLF